MIKTIATEVVGAAQAGTPMDLIQIRTRLGELGVDVDSILPKPFIPEPPTSPAAPQTPERPQLPEKPELPPHLNNPLDPSEMLRKIMPLLGRLRIDREVALTIYKEVQAAAAKGTPMTVEQIVKRLSALGVPLSGVKLPTL